VRTQQFFAFFLLVLGWNPPCALAAEEWPSYNNTLDSQRFSPLKDISLNNVAGLKEKCELALGDDGSFQSGIVVVGDTLYVTTANTAVALSATDCTMRWRYAYAPEEQAGFRVNRGVGYLDGKIFLGTSDGNLLALDAQSGRILWRVKAAEPKIGESFSAAPIAWGGLVFIGPSGGDFGIRGRIAAFDASNGKEIWRFHTIPMGKEPGSETWNNVATAQRGGGGTWTSYTLDTASEELFVPVGNPAPDLNPDLRTGDNLYTDSLIVLDARTGKLKWYYQFRANDGYDLDASAAPVLYRDKDNRLRVTLGTKDGYVYSIDRSTHRLIFKTPITTITNVPQQASPEGTRACPGAFGGVEWNGPAYSPMTKYVYVGSVDWCSLFRPKPPTYVPGRMYIGGDLMPAPGEPKSGWINALNADNGKVIWRYHAPAPVLAGITPTAGGLIFGGDLEGNLLAFAARTGKVVLRMNLGGALAGGVVSYSVGGHQYIAAAAGNLSRASFGTIGTPRLVILTTALALNYPVARFVVQAPKNSVAMTDSEQGKDIFTKICSACHGAMGEGGTTGPELINESSRKELNEIVAFIKNPLAPMPKLYPALLTDEDVRRVATYIASLH
jgi:alcohol dehydrogenase (cytochrome c)